MPARQHTPHSGFGCNPTSHGFELLCMHSVILFCIFVGDNASNHDKHQFLSTSMRVKVKEELKTSPQKAMALAALVQSGQFDGAQRERRTPRESLKVDGHRKRPFDLSQCSGERWRIKVKLSDTVGRRRQVESCPSILFVVSAVRVG